MSVLLNALYRLATQDPRYTQVSQAIQDTVRNAADPKNPGVVGSAAWQQWLEIYYDQMLALYEQFEAEALTESIEELRKVYADQMVFEANNLPPEVQQKYDSVLKPPTV